MLKSPNQPAENTKTSNDQSFSVSLLETDKSGKSGEHTGSTQMGVDAALAEPFAAFAHQEVLETPFEEETRRDSEFQEQLHQRLLDLILEFHAWSLARPDFESTTNGEALFEETRSIQRMEGEQGMWTLPFEQSRLRLVEFIARIKAALAVLTGFGL